jgi:hypothetical protein
MDLAGLLMAAVACASGVSGQPIAIYVAPSGDDTSSGTEARPFVTLERGRDEIRKLKGGGPLKGRVTVYLRGGVYRIEKTVEFTPEDSGTEQAPITYAACEGERPVISGGRPITGWQKGFSGALWTVTVPDVKEGRWYFHQLFVNGERRTRARTPNVGYLYSEGILAPFNHSKWSDPKIKAKRGFRFREGDIKRWKNFDDAIIVIYHSWTTSIHHITELDPQERIVMLAPPSVWPIGYWWEYNTRYQVENIFEALDQPGEWYLDRTTGVLYYWPMPGEDMTKAEVIAPVVRQTLVAFKGQPAEKKLIEHLRFQGISFQHTDCYIAADMGLDHQGATEQKPMIAAKGLRHSVFEECEIAHAGENALWLDSGCADNVIRRCHIHDLGGSAVFIEGERNVVDNCFIHDGSHIFRGSQGVWIGRSSFNQVTHNEISDFHHLGISVGHSWGYAPSSANNNLIAFNRVHHICNGLFSDGGGIYTLGISPGTVIRNNIVHDVTPTPLMPVGGTGIYHDEGSTGILVESNIVYNVGAGAYNQHYGRENVARNNIFAFGGRDPITCCRPEEHLSFTFEGNIVLSSAGQATSDHFSPLRCKTEFRRNLYWDTSGREPLFSGVSFAEWQRTGRDRDSRIADPQFYDAKNGDFRLKPTSPALAMGFKPIATEQVGLYGDPEWVAAPSKVKHEPLPELPAPPPPPPPRPFFEDLESTTPGQQPEIFAYSPADRPELIQVTEETPAGGKRCLKLAKIAGLKYPWQPHLYYSSKRYGSGVIRFACDLKNSAEHPAECYVGLRDWSAPGGQYREGPSLLFKADGTLNASEKGVTQLPLGQWVHIEIEFDPAASKTYRLAVTVSGDKAQVFDKLPFIAPEFAQLTWFGFSSSGKPGSVYYVDNIRLELSGGEKKGHE